MGSDLSDPPILPLVLQAYLFHHFVVFLCVTGKKVELDWIGLDRLFRRFPGVAVTVCKKPDLIFKIRTPTFVFGAIPPCNDFYSSAPNCRRT